MKLRIPKLTAEHFFGFMLALYWGKDIIFSYLRAIILGIPLIKYTADYIMPILMLICFALAFKYIARNISWKDIVFAGSVAIVYLINILIYPENAELGTITGSFFLTVFPLYFVGLRLEVTKHFKLLYIMSIVNICAFAVYYLVFNGGSFEASSTANESFMGRAYVLLPQVLIVFMGILNKRSIYNVITGIMGTVLLLMCGNRGSVLLLLVFVATNLLFSTKKEKRALVYIGTFSLVGFITYYYETLLTALILTFSKIGFSTRIFERLFDGTFLESDGRNLIIEKLATAIWENPILGYGLCSDRTITGSYAHNYAFELWTAFGVIMGSAIIIATIVIIIKAWKTSADKNCRSFLLVLLCSGFLKLFLSSSFLYEGLFFLLLGYCVNQISVNRTQKAVIREFSYENL